jgi:hypothetical protein
MVRANVRTAMAPDVLDRLAAEGAALTLDEAVAYALETSVAELRSGSGEMLGAPPGRTL